MWAETFLKARKVLALYEKAMNASECDVAMLAAQELAKLSEKLLEEAVNGSR